MLSQLSSPAISNASLNYQNDFFWLPGYRQTHRYTHKSACVCVYALYIHVCVYFLLVFSSSTDSLRGRCQLFFCWTTPLAGYMYGSYLINICCITFIELHIVHKAMCTLVISFVFIWDICCNKQQTGPAIWFLVLNTVPGAAFGLSLP